MSQPSPLAPALDRARSLIAVGSFDAAQLLLERAVEVGREKLGEDEPDVLMVQRELAGVYLRTDDPMAARRVLEDAYAAGQWRLGDSDPLMLHISHDLGVVSQELGNKHEARKAFGRVAANGPVALGDGHEFIARARAYLAEDPAGATVRPEPPSITTRAPSLRPDPAPHPGPVPQPAPAPPTTTEPPVVRDPGPPAPPAPAPHQPYRSSAQPGPQPPFQVPPPQFGPVPPQPWRQGQNVQQGWQPPHRQSGIPHPQSGIQYPQSGVPHRDERPAGRGGRAVAIILTTVATVVSALAVGALVVVLADRSQNDDTEAVATPTPTLPTIDGTPPSDVKINDKGSTVYVTWDDPTDGRNGFVVSMGQESQVLKPVSQVGPGQTRATVRGLNPDLEYCFAVVAIYATNKIATSLQVCTNRK